MFLITPADEQKTAALAKREGVDLPAVALVLFIDGTESGHVLLRFRNSVAEIACLRAPDAEYEEWLIRAALNTAANRSAIDAECFDPMLFDTLKRLGFSPKGNGYEVFIPEFFNRPCIGG